MDMLNRICGYASLLVAAVMLASCGNEGDDAPVTAKELVVSVDKNFVQTFGDDYITLTVTLGGEPVTEGVTFFDEDDDVIPVENFRFMTDEPGEHKISANYGTYFSKAVTVTAIAVEIPESPADPKPQSVNFKPRVLLTQFTTTGCSYCPQMKLLLKETLTDDYLDKIVKMDCHSSIVNYRDDPAYVHLEDFETQCAISGFPAVNIDMAWTSGNYNMGASVMRENIDAYIDFKSGKAAGIAVNAAATEDQIVAKVSMKAAETGTYRVGLVLLEDNIVANSSQSQTGSGVEDWMNTHNSCIRYMDSQYSTGTGTRFYGHSVGTVEKGKTADYVFVFDLETIWKNGILRAEQNSSTWSSRWVSDELHLAAFVSTIGTDGKNEFYYVSNVVDCPIDGETPFEYAE